MLAKYLKSEHASLQNLNLRNNTLGDEAGATLNESIKSNNRLIKINLELNIIKHKYLTEIENRLKQNRVAKKKQGLP